METQNKIMFGSAEILFSVEYRKRKSLAITVYPDGLVKVVSPLDTDIEQINERVHKKAAWIIKQLDRFQQFQPKTPPRKYISGETHYYLGRQYRLKIIEASKKNIIFKGGYIEIHTTEKGNRDNHKRSLDEWYRSKAKIKFESIFQKCLKKLPLEDARKEQLTYKIIEMPKRWGSCTPTGNILLNPNLVKTSKACIEYVILHELCHLVVPYHNKEFYDLQTRLIPDWKVLKQKLDLFISF